MSDDLVSRLSETLDEIERVATVATSGPWKVNGGHIDGISGDRTRVPVIVAAQVSPWNMDHITLWDPQAVLRLVAAAREILELHKPSWADDEPHYSDHAEQTTSGVWVDVRNVEPDPPYWCDICGDFTPCQTIKKLAAGFGVSEDG